MERGASMKKEIFLCLISFLWLFVTLPVSGKIVTKVLQIDEGNEENNKEDGLLEEMVEDPEGTAYPVTGQGKEGREYTLMVYLCGSDLESSGQSRGAATNDIREMIRSGCSQDAVTVLLMAGGTQRWYNGAVDPEDTAVYEVVGDRMVKRHSVGLRNMGDEKTLRALIDYGYESYPARHHALILWDHGSGPVGPLLKDTLYSSSMNMVTLASALEQSKAAGHKLSFIGFDACLMGSAEVAGVLAPYAEYLIASPEAEPSGGWNYDFLYGIEKDGSVAETAERILSSYMLQYANDIADLSSTDGEKSSTRKDLTLACIDLEKMEKIEELTNELFSDVAGQLGTDTYTAIAKIRQEVLPYRDVSLDLVDLGQLADRFAPYSPETAKELSVCIREAVVEYVGNLEGSGGLSTYYPYFNLDAFTASRKELYSGIGYADAYAEYLEDVTAMQSRKGWVRWDTLMEKQTDGSKDTRTTFSLLLTPEQADFVAESSLVMLQKEEEEISTTATQADIPEEGPGHTGTADESETPAPARYVVVNASGKAELDMDQLTGDYVHTALYVTDENGERKNAYPLAWTLDEGEEKLRYLVPAVLSGNGTEVQVQLVCVLDEESGLMETEGIRVWDEMGQYYSDRYDLDLESFHTVSFHVPLYRETRDEEGVLTGIFDWQVEEEYEYSFDLFGDFNLRMVEDSIDQEKLYAAFVITDYQRQTHTNEPISVVPSLTAPVFVLTYDDDYIELSDQVSLNNGQVYLMLTALSPNPQEVFYYVHNVVVNGIPSGTELWIEGTGEYDGIEPGQKSTDTLIIPELSVEAVEELQTVSFDILVADAQSEEDITTVPVTGYLVLGKE